MDTNIIYNIDCVAGMNQMIDEESIVVYLLFSKRF